VPVREMVNPFSTNEGLTSCIRSQSTAAAISASRPLLVQERFRTYISHQCPKSDYSPLNTYQQSSIGSPGAFCLICWDCRSINSISNSGNYTADDELGKRVGMGLCGDLDNNAKDHDASTHHHRAPAT
jgi:hypothetical protein